MLLGSAAALPQGTFTDSVSITASAVEESYDGFLYNVGTSSSTITGYKGTKTDITIPPTLGGKPVVRIADRAFNSNNYPNCKNIKTVILAASVTEIGYNAFQNCTSMTAFVVPYSNSSLKEIGNYAFDGCTALTTFSYFDGSKVTKIGNYAFRKCSKLASISFPSTLTSIGSYAFKDCSNLQTVNNLQKTTVDSLDGTFNNCSKLSSIFFPSTVKTLTNGAFENNSALTTIDLSGCTGLKAIGNNAFKGCTNLKTVYMPSSLETLDEHAFYDCKNLTGTYMFKNCKSLKSIKKECFTNCEKLTSLYVPYSVTEMAYCSYGFSYKSGSYGFYDCSILLYNSGKAAESAYKKANEYWYKNFTNYFDKKVKFEYLKCDNHNYTDTVTTPATCTQKGTKTYTCTICGDTYTKPIEATGHHFVESITYAVELEASTPVKKGYTKYKCEKCWGTLPDGYKTVVKDKKNVRFQGASRYETSLLIAERVRTEKYAGGKLTSVIVASGDDFADALSASYLSVVANAPILLVPKNYNVKIMNNILSFIDSSTTTNAGVYVIGGKNAIPPQTFNEIKGVRSSTERLSGSDRYETNKQVILKAQALLKANKKSLPSSAIVADGMNYADALSASAAGVPIILVYGKSKTLPANVKNLVTDVFKDKTLVIAGGDGAVSSGIQTGLSNITSTTRAAGSDRYATSVEIAKKFFPSPSAVTIATGMNYPDGLCGGLLSYSTNCPMILTAKGKTSSANAYAKSKSVSTAWILGGTAAVSDDDVTNVLKK